MKQDLMQGVIDMHVHTNRICAFAHTMTSNSWKQRSASARAIVIKTHQGTTMDRAYLCNRHNEIVHGNTNNFTMYGSITLNRVVGGSIRKPSIPHFVLEQSCLAPRHSPQNHMQKMGQDLSQCVKS